jgi:hypothetical protein
MNTNEMREEIIKAGEIAVKELIKIAKESVIGIEDPGEGNTALAADRLKNAAATKKLAIYDAFDILNRIEAERNMLESIASGGNTGNSKVGFAELKSK